MKLLNVTIEGFRNIRKTNLQMQDIMALISCNSYGKSNLIAAIKFGIDLIHAGRDQRRDMMGDVSCIPLNKETAKLDYNIVFEFSHILYDKHVIVLYELGFVWEKNDKTGRKIILESMKMKEAQPRQKFVQLVKRDEKNALYKTSPEGRCSSKVKVTSDELVIDKILNRDEWYYMDLLEGVFSLQIHIDRYLDPTELYQSAPFIRKGKNRFDLDGTDLPRIIYHLRKDYPDKYQLLMDAYHQLFPQFSEIYVHELKINAEEAPVLPADIPFTLSESIYILSVQDIHLNQPIDFNYLSDGAKRIFHVLLTVLLSDIQPLSILALEEPENSIHPALFGSYIQIISQLAAGDICIILTSHSPYLLQYMSPQRMYIGLPSTDATASFARVSEAGVKKLQKDVTAAKVSLGEYIFDLMSGDEDDRSVLEKYLEIEYNG